MYLDVRLNINVLNVQGEAINRISTGDDRRTLGRVIKLRDCKMAIIPPVIKGE
nr:hypothetical protein SYMBAF_160052 [Serratia symbiotica]